MIRRLVTLFLLMLALVLVGSASAQSQNAFPILKRVGEDLASISEDVWLAKYGTSKPGQIIGQQIVRALPEAGNMIKWGGAFAVSDIAIQASMNWYMKQAQSAAHPQVKSWWEGETAPNSNSYAFPPMVGSWKLDHVDSPFCMFGNMPVATYIIDDSSTHMRGYFYMRGDGVVGWLENQNPTCTVPTAPPFSSVPGAAAAVRDAVTGYINAHPEEIMPTLKPVPNANQLADNPYASLTDDTDGDGVPDYLEFEDLQRGGPGDPNTPLKKPADAPFEVSRETTTVKTPNGTITTTVVKYSNGKTATTVVKRETVFTTGPNGEVIATTTTTTTTTGPNGEVSTRVQTETKTSPKPEPGPDPDPDGDHDGDGVPNKDDPDRKKQLEDEARKKAEEQAKKDEEEKAARCTGAGRIWDGINATCGGDRADEERKKAEEQKREEEKAACKAGGGIFNSNTETCEPDPAKKKEEQKKKCEESNRVWDAVNETCGGEKKKEDIPDDCGTFTVERFLKHTGSVIKDVFKSCEKLDWAGVADGVKDKFPFSVVESMNSLVSADGATGTAAVLPSKIGPFDLDFGWADKFFALIKTLFRIALWYFFFNWLVNRLSGQVVLS